MFCLIAGFGPPRLPGTRFFFEFAENRPAPFGRFRHRTKCFGSLFNLQLEVHQVHYGPRSTQYSVWGGGANAEVQWKPHAEGQRTNKWGVALSLLRFCGFGGDTLPCSQMVRGPACAGRLAKASR